MACWKFENYKPTVGTPDEDGIKVECVSNYEYLGQVYF